MKRHSRNSRAFTLIEVLTVVALSCFLLTSVAVAITSLNRLNRRLQEELPIAGNVARLGLQFRTDVHRAQQATVAEIGDGSTALTLSLPMDQTIEYRSEKQLVVRIAPGPNQTKRREEFALPPRSDLKWTVDSNSSIATLSMRRHTGQIPDGTDDLHITTISAAIGLDERVK